MSGCGPAHQPRVSQTGRREALQQRQYIPKPISCKAKTANHDNDCRYQIAGLVADPHKHCDKFNNASDAMKYWHEFCAAHLAQDYRQTGNGRDGYSVDIDPDSDHYFCVLRDGKYIHADYDLLDIIDAENPRVNEIIDSFLDGAPHKYNSRFPEIQRAPCSTGVRRSSRVCMSSPSTCFFPGSGRTARTTANTIR